MCLIKAKLHLHSESASYDGKMKALVYSVGYGYFCIFLGNVYTLSCLGKDGNYECCRGYMWNETTGGCDTKCLPGFYGVNCSKSCVAGRYGEGCQSVCTECSNRTCNVSYGCPHPTTTAQEFKTVTMKQLPQQNLQNDTDASQVKDILLYIAAVFSIASFVLGLLNIMISSWRRCNVSNNSSQPSGMENEKKSYQTLMKNTIYTGPAHVVMNADTVERNFSVVMTTASCDNMSTFPDATEPKSVEEKRKQPNGTVEIYESLK